jgi:hypothetical protein
MNENDMIKLQLKYTQAMVFFRLSALELVNGVLAQMVACLPSFLLSVSVVSLLRRLDIIIIRYRRQRFHFGFLLLGLVLLFLALVKLCALFLVFHSSVFFPSLFGSLFRRHLLSHWR